MGGAAFSAFLDHMNRCYREQVINPLFQNSPDGTRAAAEFELDGEFLHTDSDLLPATGQCYRLRVGAFFDFRRADRAGQQSL